MSGDIQLTLFDPPNLIGPLGHQWTWTPAYSLCVECRRLWLATDSREQVVTHLTEPCPGPTHRSLLARIGAPCFSQGPSSCAARATPVR